MSMLGSCVWAVSVLCLPASPVGRINPGTIHAYQTQANRKGGPGRIDPACASSLTESRQQFMKYVQVYRSCMAWPSCGASADCTYAYHVQGPGRLHPRCLAPCRVRWQHYSQRNHRSWRRARDHARGLGCLCSHLVRAISQRLHSAKWMLCLLY